MKIYRVGRDYFLVPDVIKNQGSGIRYSKSRFTMQCYDLSKAEEVPMYEYLFDDKKTSNIIWCIHRGMRSIIEKRRFANSNTHTMVAFAIREFEETFKEILEKFNAEFLTLERKEND